MSNEKYKTNLLHFYSNVIKKNSKFLFFALSMSLILLFVFMFYQNFQENQNIQIAEQYSKASILMKQNKKKESKVLLEAVISKDHTFYSPLALYFIIDNNIENDNSKIIKHFDKILENSSINKENLNLIKIKKAIYLINLDKEETIVATLNPIVNSNSIWKDTAIYLIYEYFLSKGQKFKAEEYIKLLNKKFQNNK
tara:strand:+ start:321 stop:908 length:588 start_codon:yes stop_codon:yes gene_type:complete